MKKLLLAHVILSISLMISINSCSSGNGGEIIGLNQNIHHDDFEYSVTGFTTMNRIASGNDTIKASGNFYLVHFKVINRALRVNHKWDNSIGYIVDENGDRYENNKDHQLILDKSLKFGWKEMYNTPHGKADTTILVFDLPVNINRPYLMVRGGILMGDIFDIGQFLRTKVRLF